VTASFARKEHLYVSARSGIENTLYRLAWGTDRRDIEYIKASYAADARWKRAAAPGKDELVLEGRDAIVAHLESVWAKTPQPNSKHAITNVLIENETEQQADVRSYKTVVRIDDGIPVVASSGWYNDVFVNDGGTWRIRERVLLPDGQL
jgi:SnoaL-like domain